MHPDNKEALKRRVVNAAEAALAHHQYVSATDVLTGAGFLQPANLQAWKKGRVDFLERMIQANLKKISLSMSLFRQWALAKGLKPSETRYVRSGRGGTVDLRFSKSGDPGIEKNYRTHYVSPALSGRKKQRNEGKLSVPRHTIAHKPGYESVCSDCGTEFELDGPPTMDPEWPRCPLCTHFRDDFGYLPSSEPF